MKVEVRERQWMTYGGKNDQRGVNDMVVFFSGFKQFWCTFTVRIILGSLAAPRVSQN